MDEEARSWPKKINAMKVRQHFGTMLEEVFYRGEMYIIERAGKPMAALVPLTLLEQWQKNSFGQTKIEYDVQKGNKRQARKRKA
jgi:antitoxin (DNA-binding transcriptional repressor) of toxin-antitoxin stability system